MRDSRADAGLVFRSIQLDPPIPSHLTISSVHVSTSVAPSASQTQCNAVPKPPIHSSTDSTAWHSYISPRPATTCSWQPGVNLGGHRISSNNTLLSTRGHVSGHSCPALNTPALTPSRWNTPSAPPVTFDFVMEPTRPFSRAGVKLSRILKDLDRLVHQDTGKTVTHVSQTFANLSGIGISTIGRSGTALSDSRPDSWLRSSFDNPPPRSAQPMQSPREICTRRATSMGGLGSLGGVSHCSGDDSASFEVAAEVAAALKEEGCLPYLPLGHGPPTDSNAIDELDIRSGRLPLTLSKASLRSSLKAAKFTKQDLIGGLAADPSQSNSLRLINAAPGSRERSQLLGNKLAPMPGTQRLNDSDSEEQDDSPGRGSRSPSPRGGSNNHGAMPYDLASTELWKGRRLNGVYKSVDRTLHMFRANPTARQELESRVQAVRQERFERLRTMAESINQRHAQGASGAAGKLPPQDSDMELVALTNAARRHAGHDSYPTDVPRAQAPKDPRMTVAAVLQLVRVLSILATEAREMRAIDHVVDRSVNLKTVSLAIRSWENVSTIIHLRQSVRGFQHRRTDMGWNNNDKDEAAQAAEVVVKFLIHCDATNSVGKALLKMQANVRNHKAKVVQAKYALLQKRARRMALVLTQWNEVEAKVLENAYKRVTGASVSPERSLRTNPSIRKPKVAPNTNPSYYKRGVGVQSSAFATDRIIMDDLTPVPEDVKRVIIGHYLDHKMHAYMVVLALFWIEMPDYKREYREMQTLWMARAIITGKDEATDFAALCPKRALLCSTANHLELKALMQQGVAETLVYRIQVPRSTNNKGGGLARSPSASPGVAGLLASRKSLSGNDSMAVEGAEDVGSGQDSAKAAWMKGANKRANKLLRQRYEVLGVNLVDGIANHRLQSIHQVTARLLAE